MKSHEDRIKEQIKQYEKVDNMHAQLPDIFSYWQVKYFRDNFRSVCQVNNHIEFYGKPFLEAISATGCNHVISFGSGDAQVESAVAAYMVKCGCTDFTFHCVELSPFQTDRAKAATDKAGVGHLFEFVECDFNKWVPAGDRFAGAMCHHALHHVLELEHLFTSIRDGLHPKGVFCTLDLIGRNGHMRWPEALKLVEMIWRFLPEEKKYHHILKVVQEEFVNWDCSTEGFEGIRSQDILALLIENFSFRKFFAFGNLIDTFTSRGFGANYSPANPKDAAFIDFIQYLNDLLIDLGHIKPTRMAAVMTLDQDSELRCYRNWTPEFCVRQP